MSGRSKNSSPPAFHTYLAGFRGPSGDPVCEEECAGPLHIRQYTGEFWTSRQRQASSLHEISYRACFKPQLPGFFIDLLTRKCDIIYDPFSGRGTTAIEAGLRGRKVIANDANPLSRVLAEPRFTPPTVRDVAERLETIPRDGDRADRDLSMFYHPDTEREIVALRRYLLGRKEDGTADTVDRWIAMVATNRLTGHSSGFFSVYTLPPNQAVSPRSQERINRKRNQVPEYRDTHRRIVHKTKSLVGGLSLEDYANLSRVAPDARFLTGDARSTPGIPSGAVRLTVTSPPFLDIVQYREDNWLRCWFCGLDEDAIGHTITMARTIADWETVMGAVFFELFRITAPGGYVAFEVGEVRKKTVRLEEHVIPLGISAGFRCEGVLINQQNFSKTSHIWGVGNNRSGTNTNRIVIFSKSS
ncbi:methyltransferase DNA modification enzyme [Methanoregula boonei 6A8]|uniref:Methyltransferase DNA modification enzyme n=1 Tax=Methanoregula boonei (strain DSM 21154 / JCM 14090 / 6A8) TaxID=456442 RepID=A7IAF9_METB6|nr:DNA methyltransferase [Methanoregula boonei]ABS56720.1 methyltransferase DNA modification enzyme [Methanoregula boonei 6A8]